MTMGIIDLWVDDQFVCVCVRERERVTLSFSLLPNERTSKIIDEVELDFSSMTCFNFKVHANITPPALYVESYWIWQCPENSYASMN